MDLETVRLHCQRQIELRQGQVPVWTSDQMLDVVTDLQRLIENQRTDPHLAEQLQRAMEELRVVYDENRRLSQGPLWTTFKHEDGSLAMGEYAWMTEIDAFEEEAYDRGEQVRVLSETWRLVHSMIIVCGPEPEPDEDEDEADPPDQLPV